MLQVRVYFTHYTCENANIVLGKNFSFYNKIELVKENVDNVMRIRFCYNYHESF